MAASGSGSPPRQQHEVTEPLRRLGDQETERRLAERRSRLTTALGLVLGEVTTNQAATAIASVKAWLNSCDGIRSIVIGMTAQGFDLELRQFRHGWSAVFYPTGIAHSIVHGSRWDPRPWVAVQKAALETLIRQDPIERPPVEEESPE